MPRLPAIAAALILAGTAAPLAAQQLDCRRQDRSRWSESYCTMETRTLRPGGTIRVDAGPNGGVTVIGWDSREIELRARITANARSEDRAEDIGRQVRVVTSGTTIRAEGPRTGDREGWSVSYELRVPRESDLWARSTNGGIEVENLRGDIDVETRNGGLVLANLAGRVDATTTNGGVDINLSGRRWDGEGLTARTTNGGVDLRLPRDYSARLETGTVNGGLEFDFPVRVQGRISRRLNTTLGDGGPTISVTTTNGGVNVRQR